MRARVSSGSEDAAASIARKRFWSVAIAKIWVKPAAAHFARFCVSYAAVEVTEISQAVEACAFGQAAAALVARHAPGRSQEEAAIALSNVERWLDGAGDEPWPGLAMVDPARARRGRHGAILLPFRALLAAIQAAR